jgi:diketogulonate reductase-like aldo/keto reductase
MLTLTLNNDVELPALGFGVFQTTPEETREAVQSALGIGGITCYRDGAHGSTLDDPVIGRISEAHDKSPAQVMLRWYLQQGRSVIPKSTKAQRIAENLDVFDFELTSEDLGAIDALDTERRGGPEPSAITLEVFGRKIPEA